MLKLKLQYFGHLMQGPSFERTLMLEKIKGRRRRGWQKMRWLDGLINMTVMSFEKAPGDCEGQGSLACCSPWGHKELDTTEWLTVKQKQQKTTPVTLQRTRLSKVKGYRQRSSVVGRTRTRIWLYLSLFNVPFHWKQVVWFTHIICAIKVHFLSKILLVEMKNTF